MGLADDILKDLHDRIGKTLEDLKRELSNVRTGRANLHLLDGVRVDYYGTPSPLSQVATLAVADARLITVKPWEKNLIPAIEKSIKAQSDLGLNPTSDGELVRIPIPPLTQERRKQLVKVIRGLAEDAKVALRNSRREANETLKEFTDSGDIAEDDERQGLKKVQDLTDKFTATVDDILGKKEKEIMEV